MPKYMDIIHDSNEFGSAKLHAGMLWGFRLPYKLAIDGKSYTAHELCGYVLPSTIDIFKQDNTIAPLFDFIEPRKELHLKLEHGKDSATIEKSLFKIRAAIVAFTNTLQADSIRDLTLNPRPLGDLGQHGQDDMPVLGAPNPFRVHEDLARIFGVVTSAVHLNIFGGEGDNMRIWIGHRGKYVSTYPGMLSQCVVGPSELGEEGRLAAMKHWAAKKAGFSEVVTEKVTAAGKVSFFAVREGVRGSVAQKWPEPGVRYVFDLELPEGFLGKHKVKDRLIDGYSAEHTDDVKRLLLMKLFKPDCALVMLDLLIRKKLIPVDHPEYAAVVKGLRRELAFPHQVSL
ncbi:hypothetical protein B0T19DRAFT_446650 [Cercophora scortea]|uniref:Nudix hydrolase domain-containing protein n=1 Tax=Cercophora scortea TaxID=314031 RepID=A0AAE0I3P6_9PEZI|nr:hypothetical protein B0T19DRAFT_446650 [Cercophora scortea]